MARCQRWWGDAGRYSVRRESALIGGLAKGAGPGPQGRGPGLVFQAVSDQPSASWAARYSSALLDPRSSAVFAKISASAPLRAITDASARSLRDGRPVRGSIKW